MDSTNIQLLKFHQQHTEAGCVFRRGHHLLREPRPRLYHTGNYFSIIMIQLKWSTFLLTMFFKLAVTDVYSLELQRGSIAMVSCGVTWNHSRKRLIFYCCHITSETKREEVGEQNEDLTLSHTHPSRWRAWYSDCLWSVTNTSWS